MATFWSGASASLARLAPIDALNGDAPTRLGTREPVARTVAAAVIVRRKRFMILILLGSNES
jgi:hypothetical protein